MQYIPRPMRAGSLLGRRRFDHLHTELSVALGVAIPHFGLWMELHECHIDPESVERASLLVCLACHVEYHDGLEHLGPYNTCAESDCHSAHKF